jgi:hypothetical protein
VILSHPFRIGPSGAVVVVEEGSTRANAEAVAVLVGTRRGERPLQPLFGITDPAFGRLDVAEIQAGIGQFGPTGVSVDAVATTAVDDTQLRVQLTFNEETDLV